MGTSTGKCSLCGTDNSYNSAACTSCGARLPWADAFDFQRQVAQAAQQQAAQAQQDADKAQQDALRATQQAQQAQKATSVVQNTHQHSASNSSAWGFLGCAAFFIFVPIACNALFSQDPNDPEVIARKQQEADEESAISAFSAAQGAIEEQLKAPSTASFASFRDSTVVKTSPGVYSIISYVDAENSFGAKLRSKWVATATYQSKDRWIVKASLVDENN
jgi:hypothetical protein